MCCFFYILPLVNTISCLSKLNSCWFLIFWLPLPLLIRPHLLLQRQLKNKATNAHRVTPQLLLFLQFQRATPHSSHRELMKKQLSISKCHIFFNNIQLQLLLFGLFMRFCCCCWCLLSDHFRLSQILVMHYRTKVKMFLLLVPPQTPLHSQHGTPLMMTTSPISLLRSLKVTPKRLMVTSAC